MIACVGSGPANASYSRRLLPWRPHCCPVRPAWGFHCALPPTEKGRDGIGCEPASATTLAALRKLAARGKIDRDAVVVAILTGHALKDTDFIIKSQQRFEHALQGEAQL